MGKQSLVAKRVNVLEQLSGLTHPDTSLGQMRQECVEKLLFAKNDSGLCQVVWRKLYGDFIAGHDSNEMLAHFARDMGKDIALAGKIDTKHRAGKDLSHSAFGDDLLFLGHCSANIRRNKFLSRPPRLRFPR